MSEYEPPNVVELGEIADVTRTGGYSPGKRAHKKKGKKHHGWGDDDGDWGWGDDDDDDWWWDW